VARKWARELSVGAVVSVGLIVFAIAVLAITEESRLFYPKVSYWTRFDNTSGLAHGSPVRLVGVQIGTVDDIVFPTDLKEFKIKVTFRVDRAFAPRIRRGTVAYLKSLTYLSQDKYVELTPGDPEQDQLEPGGYIDAGMSAWEETLLQGQGIADDLKEITSSFRDLLVALNQGQGIVQEMIHNPEFGKQGAADLEGSLASLRRLLEGLEQGRGMAGTLLRDRELAQRFSGSLDEAMSHLKSILARLDEPEGALAQLSDPKGKGAALIADLGAGAASFRQAAETIEKGQGTIGRLVHDREYADGLLGKFRSSAGHLDSILGKIDRGEGTLGGIVNDPAVYEGLKDVVAGIQKSKIGKGMIRHYEKKGAQEREQAGEAPPPDPGPNP
jgi:phospholipid/cholesterol/gamma-HCH transport system substrate-binding protein